MLMIVHFATTATSAYIVLDAIRKESDPCDCLQGFQITC
jgi:hypothetical protein